MPAQLCAQRSGLCHIGGFGHAAHIYMTVNWAHGQLVSSASNRVLERADHAGLGDTFLWLDIDTVRTMSTMASRNVSSIGSPVTITRW